MTLCHRNSTTYNSLFAEDFVFGGRGEGRGVSLCSLRCKTCTLFDAIWAKIRLLRFFIASLLLVSLRELCHGLEFKSIVVINYLIVMIFFAKKERERERHDIEQIELRNYTYKSEYSFYCRLLFSLSMNYDFIK